MCLVLEAGLLHFEGASSKCVGITPGTPDLGGAQFPAVTSCWMGWCLCTGLLWTYQQDLASPWTTLFAHLSPGSTKSQQCPELSVGPAA